MADVDRELWETDPVYHAIWWMMWRALWTKIGIHYARGEAAYLAWCACYYG